MADNGTIEIKIDDVVYREDLYPRIEHKPALVQRYAENIDVLPPIEINQNNILIDGYHRLTAHRKNELATIRALVTETISEAQLLGLAIKRNASHGMQLAEKDKRKNAIRLYEAGNGLTKSEIAYLLSVTDRQVNNYLTDIDKQIRSERKETIFNMWLSCHTQQEIGEAVGLSVGSINEEIATFFNNGNPSKTEKSRLFSQDADYEPPIYNVWRFAKKFNVVSHFGNSEQAIVDNLLYLYTEPFDIVLDPFAGGGATIDVCRNRLRRYWVSDRKPIPEREKEIRKLDIVTEPPSLNRLWSEVSLTYLDPPYWRQAEGKYSNDVEDLANMDLADFTRALTGIIKRIVTKQSKGVIALLMQPTQWNSDNRQFTDHIMDVIKGVNSKKLILHNRVSCPYVTEQYNAQQVTWAKENKELLVLTQENFTAVIRHIWR